MEWWMAFVALLAVVVVWKVMKRLFLLVLLVGLGMAAYFIYHQ